jgi:hypothetical protein
VAGGRLRDATARLERESADCLRHSATDRTELQSKLYHQKVQAQGHAKLLKSELVRVEEALVDDRPRRQAHDVGGGAGGGRPRRRPRRPSRA